VKTDASCCSPKAMAIALARWCVGTILLVAGVGKLAMGVGSFAHVLVPMFEKTWLPTALVTGYGQALPFAETLLGAFLILGLVRNATLFVSGLLFLSLTFGEMALAMSGKQESIAVVFQNMVYTFLTAGLLFLHEYDTWIIPCRGCRKSAPAPEA
jgi:hypothetical protein